LCLKGMFLIHHGLVGKMTLTQEENSLILDYIFQCSEQEQVDIGPALIASNPKAAEIYSCIKQALATLEHMKNEICPDELVDLTIARLKLATLAKPLPHKNGSV
jgi:hypothetical protein